MTDDTAPPSPAPAPAPAAAAAAAGKNVGKNVRDPSLAWPLDELVGWSDVDVRAVDMHGCWQRTLCRSSVMGIRVRR